MNARASNKKAFSLPLPTIPDPKANKHGYDWPAIQATLAPLFTSPSMQNYGCYFYLNTIRWYALYKANGQKEREGFEDAAGEAILNSASPFVYKRTGDPPPVGLGVQYMTTLAAQPAFASDQLKKNLPAAFVALNNFGCFVPFDVAGILSTCFLKGLVSRLVLGRYQPILTKANSNVPVPVGFDGISRSSAPIRHGTTLRIDPAPGSTPEPNVAVDHWVMAEIHAISTLFNATGTWQNGYAQCLQNNINVSLQIAGILMGWRAGDRLAAASDAAATEAAIWKFIGIRNTAKHVGMMMGYTLMTLSGFLENDRTKKVLAYTPGMPTPPGAEIYVGSLVDVFHQVSNQIANTRNSNATNDIRRLIDRFYVLIKGELYGITQSPNFPPGAAITNNALESYSAFMAGFVHGMVVSADELFDSLYNQGYQEGYGNGYESGLQVGYTNGFRDGWSQGLSAGYTVGYQAGDAAGYAAGASAMGGLSNILSGVSGVLVSVSTILEDVDSVGTAISAVTDLF